MAHVIWLEVLVIEEDLTVDRAADTPVSHALFTIDFNALRAQRVKLIIAHAQAPCFEIAWSLLSGNNYKVSLPRAVC